MGTITASISDDVEEDFRSAVSKTLGTGKGKLGTAITEALAKWAKERQQEDIAKRQIALLHRGFHMGGRLFKTREELHERH